MIEFDCPECSTTIKVKYLAPGEVAQCRACGAKMKVPGRDEKPILVFRGKPKTDESASTKPSSPGKTTENGGQPVVRFRALRSIAFAYKSVAGIVAFIASVCAIGFLILFFPMTVPLRGFWSPWPLRWQEV